MIYLDANATTPVDPEVLEAMLPYLREGFANPSAPYRAGREASKALEQGRAQVAELLAAEPPEIVFTSGGTESDDAALRSAWDGWPEKRHLVTVQTEHSAIIESAKRWARSGGEVSWISVDSCGRANLDELRAALRPGETSMVSVMWANNETGVIAPIREIAELAHEAGALMHTDASQVVGKVEELKTVAASVDYLTLSGHKFHAPKGVGALFVSRRVRFVPSLLGGGQEKGRRSGTENLPGIVAMGKAAVLAMGQGSLAPLRGMRDRVEAKIRAALPEAVIHALEIDRLVNTCSVCIPGVDAAGMLILLDQAGIACSAGSACHSASIHPSHVLEAMGFDSAHASSTLRISFSRMNTMGEAEAAGHAVVSAAARMREWASAEAGPVTMG